MSLLLILSIFFLFGFLTTYISYSSTIILYPPSIWLLYILSSKRLQDMGIASWRLLLLIVPVIGPVLILYWLIFRKGTTGHNQYGDDPLQQGVDYLKVDIHQGGSHA